MFRLLDVPTFRRSDDPVPTGSGSPASLRLLLNFLTSLLLYSIASFLLPAIQRHFSIDDNPNVPPRQKKLSPYVPRAPIAPSAIPFSDSAPAPAKAAPQTQNPLRANAFAASRAPETSSRPTRPLPRLPPAPAATLSPLLLPASWPRFHSATGTPRVG